MKHYICTLKNTSKVLFIFLLLVQWQSIAKEHKKMLAPTVTLTTEPLVAANIGQGSNVNLIYTVKIISTEAFTLNNITFKTSGTFTAGNITSAILKRGGSIVTSVGTSSIAAGGNISFNVTESIAANAATYYSVEVNVSSTAANGNIIKIDGGANPVTLTSTLSTLTITNNQTDIAGPFTIVAPLVTLSTEPITAGNISRGSESVIYSMKITTNRAFSFGGLSIKLNGNFVAGDIATIKVGIYSTPTPSSTSLLAFASATSLSNGGTFNISTSGFNVGASSTNYIIIFATPSNTATINNTIKINGSLNPITFTNASASPVITNNQTDIAGLQTIVNPQLTLSTEPTTSSTVLQSTAGTLYVLKLLSPSNQTISGLSFNLLGTFTSTDFGGPSISAFSVFHNTSPTATSGTSLSSTLSGNSLNVVGSVTLSANVPKYIIVRPYISSTGVNGHTIKIDGSANPVTISAAVTPTIINNQTDVAGILTIQGPILTVTTEPKVASTVIPNSSVEIYNLKVISNKTTKINQLSFKIDGTFTAGKIVEIYVYESTNNTVGGSYASLLPTLTKTSGDIFTFTLGSSYGFQSPNVAKYYKFIAKISSTLPDGFNVKVDGSNNMLAVTGSTTYPGTSFVNNQTDVFDVQSVLAPMPPTGSSTQSTIMTNVVATEKTAYSTSTGYEIITTMKANPQITGNIQCVVYPTGGATLNYVNRHYEMTLNNASVAGTATITLYFTQAEFDNYNALSVLDLPTSNTDATGKANLRITKFAGTSSSNGTVYTGSSVEIDPDDTNIIYQNGRWEVTFDANNFSGFFLGTAIPPCPTSLTFASTADDYSNGILIKEVNATTGTIIATNKITNTANVTYRAGKSITLNAGFKADNGTVFKTEFGGCN